MMETLEAKKVRLLSRWLEHYFKSTEWASKVEANLIITLLEEIEQAHYSASFEMSGVRYD